MWSKITLMQSKFYHPPDMLFKLQHVDANSSPRLLNRGYFEACICGAGAVSIS